MQSKESPYAPAALPEPAAAPQADEVKTPSQEELAAFVSNATDAAKPKSATMRVIDPATGEVKEQDGDTEVALNEQTLTKVAAFLDPTSRGPITLLPARHKLFALRVPTQQEILDVTAITGAKAGVQLNAAEAQWSIIGELRKAIYGWVPLESPEAQLLRANLAWPKKWPALREPQWTESRDPYVISEEVIPLWTQYLEWRKSVIPTRAEIDFYWASQR